MRFTLCAWLVAIAVSAVGQQPVLVKDLNTTTFPNYSSRPYGFTAFGGDVYFGADGPFGIELYRTGGTPATTRLVTDLNPGGVGASPAFITPLPNGLVFAATVAPVHGLYRTDGSGPGTSRILGPSSVSDLQKLGNIALLSASSSAVGQELWRTDGTATGTTLVRDLYPGPGSSRPSFLTVHNGFLYFLATDPVATRTLWRTDGTPSGTAPIATIPSSGLVSEAASNGAYFCFSLRNYSPASETVWRSDGTAAGTFLLRTFTSPLFGQTVGGLTPFGNRMVFLSEMTLGNRELWATDGTVNGTTPIKIFSASGGLSIEIVRIGTVAYFGAYTAAHGFELWRTDATPAGTTLVSDINPGTANSNPHAFAALAGRVYFFADDGVRGEELWTSDGTAAGTTLVKDIFPQSVPRSPSSVYTAASRLWFPADDGTTGLEPWISDGTAGGTGLVADLRLPTPGTENGSPRQFIDIGRYVLFTAQTTQHGEELWRTDGTGAGTTLVKDVNPGADASKISDLTLVGNRVFFNAEVAHAKELWVSDGTAAGTRRVRAGGAGDLTALGNILYFVADTPSSGSELHRTDGTPAGTWLVRDIWPGPSHSLTHDLIAAGDRLFFAANDGQSGDELWTSDGTAAGTVQVEDINPGAGDSHPGLFTLHRGILYFSAQEPQEDWELWRSDGTAAGTVRVSTIVPGIASINIRHIASAGPNLFFSTYDYGYDGVWVTDGTAAGTKKLATINVYTDFGVLGHRVFFGGWDPRGVEPWVSDGTVAGTGIIKDLNPAFSYSVTGSVFVPGGSRFVWFRATDGSTGTELWVTDGTAAGTRRVADLSPGSGSSAPNSLTVARGSLFFSAVGGPEGRELWKVDLDGGSSTLGRGCGNGLRQPTLAITDPRIGRPFTLSGDNGAPGSVGVVLASANLIRGIHIGGGCYTYIDPASFGFLTAYAATSAQWSVGLALPAEVGLVGITTALQAYAGPTAAPLGFDFTNAVHARIGR